MFLGPRGRTYLRLVDPNTSSPSKWDIFNVYEETKAYLATIVVIYKGSPNWLALCNHNSFLFGLILEWPPCVGKHSTMQIAWKLTHNHLKSRHIGRHFFSHITKNKHCELFLIGYKSTRRPPPPKRIFEIELRKGNKRTTQIFSSMESVV